MTSTFLDSTKEQPSCSIDSCNKRSLVCVDDEYLCDVHHARSILRKKNPSIAEKFALSAYRVSGKASLKHFLKRGLREGPLCGETLRGDMNALHWSEVSCPECLTLKKAVPDRVFGPKQPFIEFMATFGEGNRFEAMLWVPVTVFTCGIGLPVVLALKYSCKGILRIKKWTKNRKKDTFS